MNTKQMDTLADLVSRVQARDSAAFDALMERFQDLVYGLALTRARRREDAQDICQEAFLEAYQRMGQLREPHYLPTWLSLLVVKHADRLQRRRAGPTVDPALADALPAAGAHDPDEPPLAALRAALAKLPSGQRLVLVLHHLCGRPVAEIAQTLDLAETAVKKRLFDGRKRLEARLAPLLESAQEPMPSQDAGLSRVMRFFLAVRRGELEAVAALLREEPALIHEREQWTVDHGAQVRLPDASRQTALIRAAQNGDHAMIDLLLAHGARVADACGCANGEQALHAAVVAGSLEAVERLLRSHADLTRQGFRGFTPLHVAAMREREAILALLLRHGAPVDARDGGGRTALMWAAMHGSQSVASALLAAGADPTATDAGGRTAVAWARLRGHHGMDFSRTAPSALGPMRWQALGGRRFGACGQALDGGCALEDALRTAAAGTAGAQRPGIWWTGIKAIDLFCPLPAGGRVAVHGGHGVGRLVVMCEISRRLVQHGGLTVLWVGWEQHHAQYSDIVAELAEVGVDGHICTLWHRQADPAADAAHLGATAARTAQALRAAGRDVLLWVVDHPDHRDQVDALLALAGRSGGRAGDGRIGVALVYDLAEPPPSGKLAAGWDARIAFDVDLRALGCYPALHPVLSLSRTEQSAASARARQALARLRSRPGWPSQLEELPVADARALKLQWFLSQPFDVTEFLVLCPGEHVGRASAADTAERILDGAYDELPLERLRYQGEAPPP